MIYVSLDYNYLCSPKFILTLLTHVMSKLLKNLCLHVSLPYQCPFPFHHSLTTKSEIQPL